MRICESRAEPERLEYFNMNMMVNADGIRAGEEVGTVMNGRTSKVYRTAVRDSMNLLTRKFPLPLPVTLWRLTNLDDKGVSKDHLLRYTIFKCQKQSRH